VVVLWRVTKAFQKERDVEYEAAIEKGQKSYRQLLSAECRSPTSLTLSSYGYASTFCGILKAQKRLLYVEVWEFVL
jgi:hypothetical protein